MLFGTMTPFTADELAARYPGGRSEYLRLFTAALDETIAAGSSSPPTARRSSASQGRRIRFRQ